jgi:hypothetical protein
MVDNTTSCNLRMRSGHSITGEMSRQPGLTGKVELSGRQAGFGGRNFGAGAIILLDKPNIFKLNGKDYRAAVTPARQ